MKLTRPLVVPIGVNALGGIEFIAALVPICIDPDTPVNLAKRLWLFLGGVAIVAVDLWWRFSDVERDKLGQLLSPFAGGAFFYLPGWLWGLFIFAIAVFSMVPAK